jgi:hypothetical protein
VTPGSIRNQTVGWRKPQGWDDELDGPCGTLSVRHEVETLSGLSTMTSLWELTDDDRLAIARGQPVMLRIYGTVHPVVSVYVGEPTEREVWDGG